MTTQTPEEALQWNAKKELLQIKKKEERQAHRAMQRHLRNQIKETRGTKEESRESMRKNLDDAFHTKELAIVEWKKARSAPKISRIDVDVDVDMYARDG